MLDSFPVILSMLHDGGPPDPMTGMDAAQTDAYPLCGWVEAPKDRSDREPHTSVQRACDLDWIISTA